MLDDPATRAGDLPVEQVSPQTKTYYPGALMVLRMEFPLTQSVFSIMIAAQPQTVGSTRLYRVWARNDIVGDEARWKEHAAVEQAVLDEDLRTFAHYRHYRLPLDLRREVHVGADKLSVAYRRLLADLVARGRAALAGGRVDSHCSTAPVVRPLSLQEP